jgi:type II secretory pathway component PulM
MKRIEEKLKRKVKYLRVSYRQASGRDRLSMGLFSLLVLVYTWWVFIVL